MAWVAVAVGGGAIVGSLISGYYANEAADKQSAASENATRIATAEQGRQFDLQRQDSRPWRDAGGNALNSYMQRLNAGDNTQAPPQFAWNGGDLSKFSPQTNAMSRFAWNGGDTPSFNGRVNIPNYNNNMGQFQFDPSKIGSNPNYQFVRDQALNAADKTLASQGKFDSGNRVADVMSLANGLASNEVNNEYNRQLQASNTNYGRGVTDYGIVNQNALNQFGMNKDVYGFDTAQNNNQYNRAVGQYGMDTQLNNDLYNRDVNQYQMNYQQNQDMYNRAVGQYGMDYQRNNDIYGRDQNYLNRLASVANVGQTANQQSAAAGSAMASNVGNIMMSNAQNQANAAQTRYGGMNNAIQGGMNNALTAYQYYRMSQPPPMPPTPAQQWT